MGSCPYTWFRGLFGKTTNDNGEACHLRVTVVRDSETKVDVALPATSARWLIDLIPDDVMTKIRAEGVPIDEIQDDLSQRTVLTPQKIFTLIESHRAVYVWLE